MTAAQAAQATSLSSPYTMGISNLQAQTFSAGSTAGTVDTSNTTVTWAQCGTVTPITCNSRQIRLVRESAGLVRNRQLRTDRLQPDAVSASLHRELDHTATNAPLSCTTSSNTGNTYVVSVVDGGTFKQTGSTSKISAFLTSDRNQVGLLTNETGSSTVVSTNANTTVLSGQLINPQSGQAPGNATPITLPNNVQVNRVTWTQLR